MMLVAAGAARSEPNWERAERLAPGQSITVHLRSGKMLKGRLEAVAADALRIRMKAGRVEQAARGEIFRLTRKSRVRGALWGLIAGFGAGAPVGAFAGPYLADWGNPSASVRLRHAAGWGLFFGGIGAGIGALAGAQATVYRAN
jgi:hypothetical protein